MARFKSVAATTAALLIACSALQPTTTVAGQSLLNTAPPSLWWVDHPAGDYAFAPFKSLSFSWSIEWDAGNTTAHVVGQFNYSSGHGYVGVGTHSPTGMDGLNIICYVTPGTAVGRCDDWIGSWYDIDKMDNSRTTVLASHIGSNGVTSITFRRIAFENGRDRGEFTWGDAKRVIWAYGPGGEDAGEHPGEGIWANLMDFQTGAVPVRANPATHLHAAYAAAAFTGLLIVIIQATVLLKVQVHHYAREGFGYAAMLVYLGLFVWYIVACKNDYSAIAALGPVARAMGDGAAASLAVLLLSGTRRFIPQTLFTVSHERMIVYHTVAGLAFVVCLVWHMLAMAAFYFWPYMFRWSSQDPFAMLPGVLAGVLTVFVVAPAVVRFHISYRFFRIMHWFWAPVVVLTILHVPRLLWACLPGLVGLGLNFVYGKVANCGARVERVTVDAATRCVVMDISRPFYAICATGDAPDMGITPAQWFYLVNLGMSLSWHPFSVARAEVLTSPDGSRRQHLRFVIKDTNGQAGGGGIVTTLINKALKAAGQLDRANEARAWGSWTSKVFRAAQGPEPANALSGTILEGPFGRLQMPVLAYQHLIFVSGGIGVTPNLLTLQYVANIAASRATAGHAVPWKAVLWTWVNRDPAMLALFASDIAKYKDQLEKAGVMVIVRHFVTRSNEPRGADAADAAVEMKKPVEEDGAMGEGLASEKKAVTGGGGANVLNDSAALPIEVGVRPVYGEEFCTFAAAIANMASSSSPAAMTAAMYSCGPLPMIDAAGQGAAACTRATQMSVHHHHEEFDV